MRRLLAVASGLALLVSAVAPVSHSSRALARGDGRYAVIIVLDGQTPAGLVPSRMPNLRFLLKRGITYRQAFVGQLIAITPTSHATIGTGVFPRRHGVFGFWWKDARTNTVTRPTDTDKVDAGALEAVMSDRHVPSIAASVKAAYPGARIASVSGHKCYASDAMGTAAADYILCAMIYHDRWVAQAMGRHRPPPGAVNNARWDVPIPAPGSGFAPRVEQWRMGEENDWTVRYALWTFHRVHYPRVLMINLPETDVLGHFANNPTQVTDFLMQRFDRELGEIINAYRRAHIFSRTDFVITSDHGMDRIHYRLPFSIVGQSMDEAHATKVVVESDTATAIGIAQPGRAWQVAMNLGRLGGAAVDATLYKVYSHRQWHYLPAAVHPPVTPALLRAYIALADTTADPNGPDVLAIYAPHVTTGDRPNGAYHWLGGHLGPQWEDQHIPLIISGPGVRRGATSSYPARLVDIAPTVEHLLGASSAGTDGVVLEDALSHPDRAGETIQRRRSGELLPIVRLLQKRMAEGGPS